MPISIGKIRIDRPLFMAPMEGITDLPFRRIVKAHGCGVVCTQMVHAEGILRGDLGRMARAIEFHRDETPIGFQLCGHDPIALAEAAKRVEQRGADFIDLNMGCPAKKVVRIGAGAALLRTPELATKIVEAVTTAVSIPVTAKIRAGWDHDHVNALEFGTLLEKAGIVLLTVHARTKAQGHKGDVNWDLIRQLKTQLSIPIIGNGGIFHPEDVAEKQESGAVDGLMIARGALGNPWIFSQKRPTFAEVRTTLLAHLEEHLTFYPDQARALLLFRKNLVWYTKGLPHSAPFRDRVYRKLSLAEIQKEVGIYFDQIESHEETQAGHA